MAEKERENRTNLWFSPPNFAADLIVAPKPQSRTSSSISGGFILLVEALFTGMASHHTSVPQNLPSSGPKDVFKPQLPFRIQNSGAKFAYPRGQGDGGDPMGGGGSPQTKSTHRQPSPSKSVLKNTGQSTFMFNDVEILGFDVTIKSATKFGGENQIFVLFSPSLFCHWSFHKRATLANSAGDAQCIWKKVLCSSHDGNGSGGSHPSDREPPGLAAGGGPLQRMDRRFSHMCHRGRWGRPMSPGAGPGGGNPGRMGRGPRGRPPQGEMPTLRGEREGRER